MKQRKAAAVITTHMQKHGQRQRGIAGIAVLSLLAIALVGIGLFATYQFVDPAPPGRIVLATDNFFILQFGSVCYALLTLFALLAAALAALWPAIRLARTPPSNLLKVFANDR